MLDKIAKLIDLKSIVTISITLVMCMMAYQGRITTEQFIPIVTMIYMFYFQKKSEEIK